MSNFNLMLRRKEHEKSIQARDLVLVWLRRNLGICQIPTLIFKQKKLRECVLIDYSMRRIAYAQSTRIPSESSRKTRSLHFDSCKSVWSACLRSLQALKILYICAGSTEPSLLVCPFMKLLVHEKIRLCGMRTTQAQISLRICAISPAPSCSLSRNHMRLVETKTHLCGFR